MKVLQVNYSDFRGGAARAAYRIHRAVRKSGIDSVLYVNEKNTDDWTVVGPNTILTKYLLKAKIPIGRAISKLLNTENPVLHSPAIVPTRLPIIFNENDADVVNLHWVAGEMLSVRAIGKIKKPLVWTIHDMWAFCGAEHYTEDRRWANGYHKLNRPTYEAGIDINRWTWRRKLHYWRRPFHIITPSRWLAECARESVIMRDWPISVVPNPIDTDVFKPFDKKLARELLGIPIEDPILIFGAIDGGRDPRKGFKLLIESLISLEMEIPELRVVVFGQSSPRHRIEVGFPIHYIGHLYDDLSLRVLYSAADVLVVPSRLEAFGQTASEAHACGIPVVAFNNSGLTDIVKHKETGYLAKSFDTDDLATGVRWVLSDSERFNNLCKNARNRAIDDFSYAVVAKRYKEIYELSIREHGG